MDDLDRAKEIEMMQRDIALANHHYKDKQPEQIKDDDGHVICMDCGEMIPAGRLLAKPNAVRCVDCKEAEETRKRR